MDINWANLLDEIQDFRSILEQWGVTYEFLICLGISAFALFLISLREIVVWYLRISQLHKQMHQMSQQLSQLQSSVNQVQAQTANSDGPFQESAARKKFNLDH